MTECSKSDMAKRKVRIAIAIDTNCATASSCRYLNDKEDEENARLLLDCDDDHYAYAEVKVFFVERYVDFEQWE